MSQAEVNEMQDDVERLSHENEILRKERILWDSFIRRNAPNLLREESGRAARRSGMQAALTPDQKFFVATRELEALRDEIEKRQQEGEKDLEHLQSLKEESETRISEIKKEAFEFRRDIVAGALNPRTGTIVAERVTQYFDQKIKSKDSQIEKLKLKNLSLKNQCLKMEGQLQHKEEMGEVFLPIDFDQLKIENQQYMEKIEERNAELLKLKVVAGNTVQVLNNNKKKLHSLTAEYETLKKEIKQREDTLEKIIKETSLVTKEISKASKSNKNLKQQTDEYRVPEVIDYVKLKAELYEVLKKVHDWERKVEIAEMATKTHSSKSRKSTLPQQNYTVFSALPPSSIRT